MQTLYGLPERVEFCKLCVMSNQRPNSCAEYKHTADSKKQTIRFVDGVCDACRVAEAKNNIDWAARERELLALCDKHRSKDGSYDCLVPGSGGKDSFYQAHVLKFRYGMHPLTITWSPNIYTDVGRRNHSRWIHAGFDNILVTPNGRTHRLLTRLAVDNLFHAFQPFILGQKFLGPKLAAQHNIKLVFYGENEAEYGNPQADTEKAKRDWSYYVSSPSEDVFLGGTSLAVLKEKHGLDRGDLSLYMPASPESQKDIAVQYLGYYLRWRPQDAYYYAVEHGEFEPAGERTPGTYSRYNSLDDKIDDFHYYTTYIKFGVGRASYDASQEIRNGEIGRDDGVARVKRFDGEWPERYAQEIMDYLSVDGLPKMTVERFHELADTFRSPHLWNGRELRHKVWA